MENAYQETVLKLKLQNFIIGQFKRFFLIKYVTFSDFYKTNEPWFVGKDVFSE